eukprot:2695285-Rhodomonas_salina.1
MLSLCTVLWKLVSKPIYVRGILVKNDNTGRRTARNVGNRGMLTQMYAAARDDTTIFPDPLALRFLK